MARKSGHARMTKSRKVPTKKVSLRAFFFLSLLRKTESEFLRLKEWTYSWHLRAYRWLRNEAFGNVTLGTTTTWDNMRQLKPHQVWEFQTDRHSAEIVHWESRLQSIRLPCCVWTAQIQIKSPAALPLEDLASCWRIEVMCYKRLYVRSAACDVTNYNMWLLWIVQGRLHKLPL